MLTDKNNNSTTQQQSSQVQSPEMEDDTSTLPPAMRVPAFGVPSASCHWLTSNWTDIKDEVNSLIASVDATMKNGSLTPELYCIMFDRKRALEIAIRRRCRIVDEIWRCFRALQKAHKALLDGTLKPIPRAQSSSTVRFETPDPSNQAVVGARNSSVSCEGDVPPPLDAFPQDVRSCLEILSSTLIRCGVELELYDEDSRGINRIAGIGLGLAVFVTICTVVYYC